MNDIEKRIETLWSRLGVKHRIKNGHLKWKKTLRTVNCVLCKKHDREPRIDRGLPGWNVLALARDRNGKMPEICPSCALKLTGGSIPPPRTAECMTCHVIQKEKIFGLGWPGWRLLTLATKPRAETRTSNEPNRNMICPNCALNLYLKLGEKYVRRTWTALAYTPGEILLASKMDDNQANILEAARPSDNLIRAGEFESWGAGVNAVPEGWVMSGAGGELIAQQAATVRYGNYSAALTRVVNDAAMYQDVIAAGAIGANQNTHWRGTHVFFGCWVHTAVANAARISIDDGVTETYSGYHTGGGGWEWLTMEKTLAAAATQLRVLLDVDNADATVYFDGAILIEGEMVENFAHHPQQATVDAGAPPTANFLYKDAVIKAWVNFDGTTTAPVVIRDSFNVLSVVDTAVGAYTINWDTDFANNDYAMGAIGGNLGLNADMLLTVTAIAVGSCQVHNRIANTSALADADCLCLVAIGVQ